MSRRPCHRQHAIGILAEAQSRQRSARAIGQRQHFHEFVLVDILDGRRAIERAVEQRRPDHAEHRLGVGKGRRGRVHRRRELGQRDGQCFGELTGGGLLPAPKPPPLPAASRRPERPTRSPARIAEAGAGARRVVRGRVWIEKRPGVPLAMPSRKNCANLAARIAAELPDGNDVIGCEARASMIAAFEILTPMP